MKLKRVWWGLNGYDEATTLRSRSMGSDYNYSGMLADEALQVRVIQLVEDEFFGGDGLRIRPIPNVHVRVEYPTATFERPFDFYGVVPNYFGQDKYKQEQFIFDRETGKLVRMHLSPYEVDESTRCVIPTPGARLEMTDGGYTRLPADSSLGFLLAFIRHRYWPRLQISDDFGCVDAVERSIRREELYPLITDEQVSFAECWERYMKLPRLNGPGPAPVRSKLGPDEMPDPTSLRLDQIGLSSDAVEPLHEQGVHTVEDLLGCRAPELLEFAGMNRPLLEEIELHLGLLGFWLWGGGSISRPDSEETMVPSDDDGDAQTSRPDEEVASRGVSSAWRQEHSGSDSNLVCLSYHYYKTQSYCHHSEELRTWHDPAFFDVWPEPVMLSENQYLKYFIAVDPQLTSSS